MKSATGCRARQRNIDTLVDRTGKVLQTELDDWVQQMRNAVADLGKTYDASAEAAQKWRPAVQFARVQEVAPPAPTPAPRAVVRPTPARPEPEPPEADLPPPRHLMAYQPAKSRRLRRAKTRPV